MSLVATVTSEQTKNTKALSLICYAVLFGPPVCKHVVQTKSGASVNSLDPEEEFVLAGEGSEYYLLLGVTEQNY